MIIWKLTFGTCDETQTQHFLTRQAAQRVAKEIPDTQAPVIQGLFIDRSSGFNSKARAVQWLNRLGQSVQPQT